MELDAEKIKSLLKSDAEVFVYVTVSSTNDLGAEFAEKTALPIVIAADGQTCGRGRGEKSFYSPSGTGLYLTLVTHPDSDFGSLAAVTCGAAVAATRAVEKLTDLKPQIKWVNDIYIGEKKVCGILCRAIGGNGKVRHLVTGIGINILTKDFPDEIKNIAGSLNREIDRNILAAEIVNNLLTVENFADEYREKSCVLGRQIKYYINGTEHSGTAVDIDENCGLVVADGKEKTTLTGGEISVKF